MNSRSVVVVNIIRDWMGIVKGEARLLRRPAVIYSESGVGNSERASGRAGWLGLKVNVQDEARFR